MSACLLGLASAHAHAGGPYVVDDAAIGEPGECQVESWLSAASSGDRIAVIQPACVVKLGIPIELTATYQPVRLDGVWADLLGGQIKFIFLRIGDWVVAMSVATLVDAARASRLPTCR